MKHVEIQQLDTEGNVVRKFDHYPTTEHKLVMLLARIRAAYNMDRTRVLVDGVEV
jgi:hypothetical protein